MLNEDDLQQIEQRWAKAKKIQATGLVQLNVRGVPVPLPDPMMQELAVTLNAAPADIAALLAHIRERG